MRTYKEFSFNIAEDGLNNSRDGKKVMQAIAKKKLWVDRDSFGDSIIGTGPDKRKLRTALIDYRD